MTQEEKEVYPVLLKRIGTLQGQAYNFLTSNNIKKPDNHLLRSLINDAYLRTLTKYESGNYDTYKIPILLSKQLRDVCVEYVRRLPRKTIRLGPMPLDNCESFAAFEPTAQEKLEATEEIKSLENTMDDQLKEIFRLRADKVPHKEIAKRFKTTEGAIKMRIRTWQLKIKSYNK